MLFTTLLARGDAGRVPPCFSGWHRPTSRAELKHSSAALSHAAINTGLTRPPQVAAALIYTTRREKYPLTDKRKPTVSQTPPVLGRASFHIQYCFTRGNLTTGLFAFIRKTKPQRSICVLYFEACQRVWGLLFCFTRGLRGMVAVDCYKHNSLDRAGDLLTAEHAAMMENGDFISPSL